MKVLIEYEIFFGKKIIRYAKNKFANHINNIIKELNDGKIFL